MSYHSTRLSPRLSYGSRMGLGCNTQIIETDSGAEERIARRSSPLHRYNLRYAIKTRAQMAELRRFYWARLGAAHSFRLKDWLDFTSNSDGTSAGAFGDQQIGIGDGTTTVFQLTKTYTEGGISRIRTLTKPVDGSVTIGVNGSAVGSGWSLNYDTGVLTFSSAPTLGHAITWGGEFDVHVRFGKSVDTLMSMALDAFDTSSLDDIEVVEVIEDVGVQDEFFYGGGIAITSAVDITLSVASGRAQTLNFTASGKSAFLPLETSLPMGSPYFVIINSGANSFTLRKSDGTSVRTCSVADAFTVSLGTDGTNRIWICT